MYLYRKFDIIVLWLCASFATDGYFEFGLDLFRFRCWVSSQFPHRLLVSYITTVAFPGLVVLSNSCMLGLVVFKLWELRRGGGNGWTNLHKNRGSRLRKDCATVLGLSCVLGLSWGLASTTYVSLPGIYIFTILNALQGQWGPSSILDAVCLFLICWRNDFFLFSSQVCLCSCGPWL